MELGSAGLGGGCALGFCSHCRGVSVGRRRMSTAKEPQVWKGKARALLVFLQPRQISLPVMFQPCLVHCTPPR